MEKNAGCVKLAKGEMKNRREERTISKFAGKGICLNKHTRQT